MTEPVDVLWTGENAPRYAHPGDAGGDLVSTEAFVLQPGARRLVGTGLRIALPEGYAAFVVPRSGLAAKHGITIVNSPGTVDAGYRGEIKVSLLNTDQSAPHEVHVGDRIAQLIVMPVPRVSFTRVDDLPDSARGEGGFGSSGYGDRSGVGDTAHDGAVSGAAHDGAVSGAGDDGAVSGAAQNAQEGTRA